MIGTASLTAVGAAMMSASSARPQQGYYFSRPVVAQQFAELLKTGIPEASVVVHR
jgi:EAL domain-containing protein (putative c-di-GMP-specific phosphodiesterase class I)